MKAACVVCITLLSFCFAGVAGLRADDKSAFLSFWGSKYSTIQKAYQNGRVISCWISTSNNPTRIGPMSSLSEIIAEGEYKIYRHYSIEQSERELPLEELLDSVAAKQPAEIYLINPKYEAGVKLDAKSKELKDFSPGKGKSQWPVFEYAFGIPYTQLSYGDLVAAASTDSVSWTVDGAVGTLVVDLKENIVPKLGPQQITATFDIASGRCLSLMRREERGFVLDSKITYHEEPNEYILKSVSEVNLNPPVVNGEDPIEVVREVRLRIVPTQTKPSQKEFFLPYYGVEEPLADEEPGWISRNWLWGIGVLAILAGFALKWLTTQRGATELKKNQD